MSIAVDLVWTNRPPERPVKPNERFLLLLLDAKPAVGERITHELAPEGVVFTVVAVEHRITKGEHTVVCEVHS